MLHPPVYKPYERETRENSKMETDIFLIKNLTLIAISRYRFSSDKIAYSLSALSAKIPWKLKTFRNSFSPLQNWRWKNEDRASCDLNCGWIKRIFFLLIFLLNIEPKSTYCFGKTGMNTSLSNANFILSEMAENRVRRYFDVAFSDG